VGVFGKSPRESKLNAKPSSFYPVAQDKTGIFLQYTEPQHKRNRRALSLSYQPNGQDKNGLHEHLFSLMVIQEQENEIWLGSGPAIGKSKTHAAGGRAGRGKTETLTANKNCSARNWNQMLGV
jgi:hypothetical protein